MRNQILICFSITLISVFSQIKAQQPYIRKDTGCSGNSPTDNTTSAFGYICNGVNRSCRSYLTVVARPPLNTVAAIAAFSGADPSEISKLNSVPQNSNFETEKIVLVPVSCSCSNQRYLANGSYTVRQGDTFQSISIDGVEGLSTCQALLSRNPRIDPTTLSAGMRLSVPLRCACPSKNQSDDGARFLLSYVVKSGDFVSSISERFAVATDKTLSANGLSMQDATIYPNTTLLVPLMEEPTSTQVAESPAAAPPPPPPPLLTPTPGKSSSNTWKYVLAGVLGGFACLSAISGLVFLLFARKRRKRTDPELSSAASAAAAADEKPLKKKSDDEAEISYESVSELVQSIKIYTFDELKSGTDNFSNDSWISGSVYRGEINGDLAAIKKVNGDVSKEINLLSKINHFNLISLSGICFNDGDWYLVFEYAENGPLINNLRSLSWMQRIQIGLDVATGLNYLHSYTSPPHVHKNLSSSNVLLDRDSRAKIANFALSRSADAREGEFALTRHIVGTKGYMAPEYLEHGLVSPKLDVYAFGVLVLEMLTGKDVLALQESSKGGETLSELLRPVVEEETGNDRLIELIDPSLQGKYPADFAVALVRLVDSCIKKDASSRPNMDEIVRHFSRALTTSISWESSSST